MTALAAAYVAPTNAPAIDRDVLALLRPGSAAARTCADIGRILGVSERTVRGATDRLIKEHGVLVGSSTEAPAGIFLVATEAERTRYHSQLVSRLREVADRARRVKRLPLYGSALPEAQLQIWGEEET